MRPSQEGKISRVTVDSGSQKHCNLGYINESTRMLEMVVSCQKKKVQFAFLARLRIMSLYSSNSY